MVYQINGKGADFGMIWINKYIERSVVFVPEILSWGVDAFDKGDKPAIERALLDRHEGKSQSRSCYKSSKRNSDKRGKRQFVNQIS